MNEWKKKPNKKKRMNEWLIDCLKERVNELNKEEEKKWMI